jgi:hypothetical protein
MAFLPKGSDGLPSEKESKAISESASAAGAALAARAKKAVERIVKAFILTSGLDR